MTAAANGNNVMCAVDVNDFDQEVVDMAAYFASHTGRPLDLVHVTLMPDPSRAAWPAFMGSPDSLISDARLLEKISTHVKGVQINHHQLSGFPSEKLLDFVASQRPRLLVMGTHGRRGLSRVLLGSVAEKVMRHASCPVLVLRRGRDEQLSTAGSPHDDRIGNSEDTDSRHGGP
ncbi:MAG: universal stress protein [Pirellulaceae bacterium]